uniref:Rab-GAP TBC domain-containing protein n=1 Tax=Trichuris muris TaxID=70415 RepID=A0A5S6PYT8_TRIMR
MDVGDISSAGSDAAGPLAAADQPSKAHCLGSIFKDSGVDLFPGDEPSAETSGPSIAAGELSLVLFNLETLDGESTLRKSARSVPVGNDLSGEHRGHVRHHSYEPCGPKFFDEDCFRCLDPGTLCDGVLRRNSVGKVTDVSSSSSFSIGSLSLSDYSTSLASVCDDLHPSSSGGDSKHSSLDRRSFGSDSSAREQGKEPAKVLGPLCSILPKNLFFRKNVSVGTYAGEPNRWKIFGRLYQLSSSCPSSAAERRDFVPSSALILEDRPATLPPKSVSEEQRQRQEYAEILDKARKKEQLEMKQRQRELKEQLKREEQLSASVKEWCQEILPHWNELKSTKRVKELWENGLPPCVRGRVWQLAIGNDLNVTEDLFHIFLNRARERLSTCPKGGSPGDGDGSEPCDESNEEFANHEGTVELIHLDVARTFPTLGIFQKGGPFYDLLLNILSAYACYRPDVGYVQGMSFVAAVLLLNLDLFDAFVAFCNLLNRPTLLAFFRVRQSEMERYFSAYDLYFKLSLPNLHAHFVNLDVRPELYLIDWLYTLFARSLPLEITCRVWDLFLRDGELYLFDTALGVLCTYESALLTMDFDRVVQFLTRLPERINANELFKRIRQVKSRVDKEREILFNRLSDDRVTTIAG